MSTEELEASLQAKIDSRSGRWSEISGSKNLDSQYLTMTKDPSHAYEFMCICDPFNKSYDEEEEEDDEDEDDDEEEGDDDDGNEENQNSRSKGKGPAKQACDRGETCPCGKPSSSLPSHPYTLTRAGMAKHGTAGDMMNLRNPDEFAMYTYNDHAAYGALEVVENLVQDFNDAFTADDWREAWAVLEGLALFYMLGNGGAMSMADDGERIQRAAELIARMMLAGLAMLEAEGQLTKDSDVKNIGWMIALYLEMADEFRETDLVGDVSPSRAKTFKFNADNIDLYLASYAKRCDIILPGKDEMLDDENIAMPKADVKDPWGWKNAFKNYAGGKKVIGGDDLDITTWSSADRKRYAFKKEDPLPRNLEKQLSEGLVFILQ